MKYSIQSINLTKLIIVLIKLVFLSALAAEFKTATLNITCSLPTQ